MNLRLTPCILILQRISAHLHAKKMPPYTINLDPVVREVPFPVNIGESPGEGIVYLQREESLVTLDIYFLLYKLNCVFVAATNLWHFCIAKKNLCQNEKNCSIYCQRK